MSLHACLRSFLPSCAAEGVVTASILCIDDEPAVGAFLEHTLTRAGYGAILVSSVELAARVVAQSPIDLIIADDRMSGVTGLHPVDRRQEEHHRIPVILMTGHAGIEDAVGSFESGAIDYLIKPIRAEILEMAVRRALELVRLRRENEVFRRELTRIRAGRLLVGDSPAFRRTMEFVAAAAASRATVVLYGEPGTGKELFARAIHDLSPWADQPFITVNCAALPEGLVESALLGHGKGGAGAFEQAHGGTLLLDEISEMPSGLQASLLTMIQEQQESIPDVRLIATTNRDLRAEVEAGRFRRDLYDRLNVLPVRVPTLRERMEDVPRLVRHFARRAAELRGEPPPTIAPDTLEVLQSYSWPGNVRELANAVERAVLLCRGNVLQPGDIDRQIRDAAAHPRRPAIVPDLAASGREMVDYNLDAIERLAIERALAATGGNRTRAARLLGISERTLRNKLNAPRAASGD
jgi:DNA-binding NtrC family response regulator